MSVLTLRIKTGQLIFFILIYYNYTVLSSHTNKLINIYKFADSNWQNQFVDIVYK